VDDVHGWNFRGTKDGTIIENEQASSTQFYLAWKDKYEIVDSNLLRPGEKKEFLIYIKARKDYLDKLNSNDSAGIEFTYNINYNSAGLIANDSANSNNRYYGSPYFKLSPNLTHGTHVAGIIAAQRNNQKGIDGIADNVLIMPVVASTAVGDERDKDVANAIYYAVDNGAKIINISFSKIFSSDKDAVDKAVRYAEKKNVLIIHCAGNDGVNIDSAIYYHYPIAIYENGNKAGNFITVGWSRPLFDYRLAHPYSDYGKMNVDLFAPGSDIFSTVPNNGYDFKSGSSMSAPVVSGVAALLFSYFPSLSVRQVKEILLNSTFKPDQIVNRPQTMTGVPFNSLSASGGIVNAYNAIKMAMTMMKKK
jgi:subtilisin family serine protease